MTDVRMPDGTIIQNVPEGITQDELTRRIGSMQQSQQQRTPSITFDDDDPLTAPVPTAPGGGPSGQTALESAQEIGGNIAKMITGREKMTPTMERLKEIGAAPELTQMNLPSFKASVGLMLTGKTNELKSILKKQFGKDVSFEEDEKGNTVVNLPSGQFALNKPGLTGQDLVRGVTDALNFSFVGRVASVPKAMFKNAVVEAATETAEVGVGGEFSTEDVALSGLLGGGLKKVENVLGTTSRLAQGTGRSEVREAAREAKIPLLTTDIAPPTGFVGRQAQSIGEKIPIVGTGGIREAQLKAREKAVANVINDYGEFSYNVIVDSLRTQKNKIKNAAGNVLNRVGQEMDSVGRISMSNTGVAIRRVATELTRKGVITSEKAIGDLTTLVKKLREAPQTFTTLKENATAFREMVEAIDPIPRSQMGSRAKSLLKEAQVAMKEDMTNHAKNNLSPKDFVKWQRANAVWAGEAKLLTKTKLKNVLDKGDVTPEAVESMLFSRKPSEVQLLFDSLTPVGRKNARTAIINKVTDNLGRRVGVTTPNAFFQEMRKLGMPVETFFKGEEKRKLKGLLLALSATARAEKAGTGATVGQSIAILGLAGVTGSPLTTLGFVGGLGAMTRLYEHPFVRNTLLRLNSIPKGSTQFEQVLGNLFEFLRVSAQTSREQQQ